jgi:multicomponent Na+:H+ antiporter subunit F
MSFIELSIQIAIGLIGFSLIIIFYRILAGPSTEDRIVALDLLTSNAIAFIAVYSLQTGSIKFLDVGIIFALISFLGTVAFSFYLERRTRK